MIRFGGMSLLVMLGAGGCDGPGGQLNEAANVVDQGPGGQLGEATKVDQPISKNFDKVVKVAGELEITPSPFVPGNAIEVKARFNQPQYFAGDRLCGEADVREYRVKLVGLNDAGSPVPALMTGNNSAPYGGAATGYRVEIRFDPMSIPADFAEKHPGLRVTASFYQKYCGQDANGTHVPMKSDITVAHADFKYQCGPDTSDRCRYVRQPAVS